jgi:hypothetical protein
MPELDRLLQDRCRRAGDDPNNIWVASQAVRGYLALAEHALAFGASAKALGTLEKASGVLSAARRTAPELLVLRSLAVRLETLRVGALRSIGKNEEAAAAAKTAVDLAEPLAREEPAYLYDLACAHALQARLSPAAADPPAAAVKALQAAVNRGFDNVYKLEHDERLAPLRSRKDFQALIRGAKDGGRVTNAGG